MKISIRLKKIFITPIYRYINKNNIKIIKELSIFTPNSSGSYRMLLIYL